MQLGYCPCARPLWGRDWSIGLREGMGCVSSVGDGVRGVGACVSGVCVAVAHGGLAQGLQGQISF